MKSNENIKQYLDDYVSHTKPGFAVLLNGNWGCGKTHFIENYIKEKQEKIKDSFLYISLNGLKSTEQIDSEIFSVLHPVMASKGMKLLTSVLLSGISKFGFDIKAGMLDGTKIEASIPKVNPIDLFDNILSKTLIFDDLERCLLSPSETLGYINKYVEHNKLRVIIIANEDEIDKSEKLQKDSEQANNADNAHLAKIGNNQNQSKYNIIKEKVIGKSFRIRGDIDSAMESFIENYAKEKGSFPDTVTRNNINIIKDAYRIFQKDNLRILYQTFYDWRILWSHLDNQIKNKKDLVQELIREFFPLSFEIKTGLNAEELGNLKNEFVDYFNSQKVEKVKTKKSIQSNFDKYNLSLNNTIVSGKNWQYFFINGIPDKNGINNDLLQSRYFYTENTPAWRKLYFYRSLSDEEFIKQLGILERELKEQSIENPGAILLIAATLLSLSKNKIFRKNKKQIVKEMKSYLLSLGKKGYLSNPKWLRISRDSYDGLGFPENDKEFQDIFDFLIAKTKENIKSYYEEKIKKLLTLDSEQFIFEIYYDRSSNYRTTPILSYIEPKEFAEYIFSLENSQIRDISSVLKSRYRDMYSELTEELDFLIKLNQQLQQRVKKNSDKPIQNIVLREFAIALNETIDKLQKYKSNIIKPNKKVMSIL